MADPRPGPSSALSLTLGDRDTHSSFELLVRAQDGDEIARNELCARYLPRLRRWAHGRLPVWAREHLKSERLQRLFTRVLPETAAHLARIQAGAGSTMELPAEGF